MSVKWLNWAFQLPPEVTGNTRLLLITLADVADDAGQSWYPLDGYDDEHPGLMQKTALSRRGLQKVLGRARATGYLTTKVNGKESYVKNGVERRYPADKRPTLYQLHETPVPPEDRDKFEDKRKSKNDPESSGVPERAPRSPAEDPGGGVPQRAPGGVPQRAPRGVPQRAPNPLVHPSSHPSSGGEVVQLLQDPGGQRAADAAPPPGSRSAVTDNSETTSKETQPMNQPNPPPRQRTLDDATRTATLDSGADHLARAFLEHRRGEVRTRSSFTDDEWRATFVVPFRARLQQDARHTGGTVTVDDIDAWEDRLARTLGWVNRQGRCYWSETCTTPKRWMSEWRNGRRRDDGDRMVDDYQRSLETSAARAEVTPVDPGDDSLAGAAARYRAKVNARAATNHGHVIDVGEVA